MSNLNSKVTEMMKLGVSEQQLEAAAELIIAWDRLFSASFEDALNRFGRADHSDVMAKVSKLVDLRATRGDRLTPELEPPAAAARSLSLPDAPVMPESVRTYVKLRRGEKAHFSTVPHNRKQLVSWIQGALKVGYRKSEVANALAVHPSTIRNLLL